MPGTDRTRTTYSGGVSLAATLLAATACAPSDSESPLPRKAGFADDAGLPQHRCTDRPILDVSGDLDPSDGDVADELEAAIEDATINGWAAGLPPGIYPMARPLSMPANAVLIGSGVDTVLQASIEPGTWAAGRAMVEIVSVDSVTLCDVVLDHQGAERYGDDQQLSFTMLMTNTNGDRIDGIEFRNPGAPIDSPHRPSGPALLMLARQECPLGAPQSSCDAPYIEGSDPGVPGDVTKNVIENSHFTMKSDVTMAFAIRVYTDFVAKRPADQFTVHAAGNTLRGNTFTGDFAWNTVELAGGGTVGNLVEDNAFDGFTLTHVDLDKGASNNIARGNHIVKAGRAPVPYGKAYNGLPTFAILDHGSGPDYRNTGNTVVGNVVDAMIEVVPGDATPTAAIGVVHTLASTVSGNAIDDLYDGHRGVGVLVLGDTAGAQVVDNVIGTQGPVNTGILAPLLDLSPQGVYGASKLEIRGNRIEVDGPALVVGALGETARFPALAVSGNRFTTLSAALPAAWIVTDAPQIWDNDITGGNDVVQLAAPGARLEHNLMGGSAGFTLQISEDATLLGNSAWGQGGLPPHPHCQVLGAAVVTMGVGPEVNDFTCPP